MVWGIVARWVLQAAVNVKGCIFSATLATILGTMAAFFLVRKTILGARLYLGMIIFVIPEVITGLALLLLFIAIGLDRGFDSDAGPYHLGLCYVCVVVSSRLMHFDMTLEEAALDLGCNAWGAFTSVTLPLILPGVLSGWLAAFTLSLDDRHCRLYHWAIGDNVIYQDFFFYPAWATLKSMRFHRF